MANVTVASDPEIMGGRPCIAGTRIPVTAILTCFTGKYSARDVAKLYGISPSKVRDAIEYAKQVVEAVHACPNCGEMVYGQLTLKHPCPECGWWEPNGQA